MTYTAEEQANLDLVAGPVPRGAEPDGFKRRQSLHFAGYIQHSQMAPPGATRSRPFSI